jgi:hypothetical protein
MEISLVPFESVGFNRGKSDLLRALQTEIQKHNLSTLMDEKDKIVITGCTVCRKHFGTVEQFKRHFTENVLSPLLDRLSSDNWDSISQLAGTPFGFSNGK